MAMKGITPRAWQMWIPGYEGRYLWNFATQRVMSCVYPGATTPTNLHTGASNPGYTLKREIDVRLGGKGTYYKHVDLANWLNPMNPRNKKSDASPTPHSQTGDSTALSTGTERSQITPSAVIETYIVVTMRDGHLKPTCYAACTGEHAFLEAMDKAKRYTIEKGIDFQIYKLVAEANIPTIEDVKITRF